MKRKFWIRRAMMFILMAMAALLLFSALVMALWNSILPGILNVPAINFGQALGILVLSKILFSGFRGGYGSWGGRRRLWRQNLQEKWKNMSPEEREKFQQDWKSRCYPGRKPENQEAAS